MRTYAMQANLKTLQNATCCHSSIQFCKGKKVQDKVQPNWVKCKKKMKRMKNMKDLKKWKAQTNTMDFRNRRI